MKSKKGIKVHPYTAIKDSMLKDAKAKGLTTSGHAFPAPIRERPAPLKGGKPPKPSILYPSKVDLKVKRSSHMP